MKELIELSNLINKQSTKNLKVINSELSKDQKQYQLYQGILSGNIDSDKEAAQILFNTTTQNSALKKLKYRLRDRLLNTVFFIDLNKATHSDYGRSKLEVQKNWALINILIDRGAFLPAINICRTTLKYAKRYDFIDIQLHICRILIRHYGFRLIDEKKYKKYSIMLDECMELFKHETKSDIHFTQISHLYRLNKDSDLIDKLLNSHTAELREMKSKFPIFKICYNYYQLESFKHIRRNDFKLAKKVCLEALNYLKNTPVEFKIGEVLFRQNLNYCHLQLNELDEAKKSISKNITVLSEGGFNWLTEWHFYFIWASKSRKYGLLLKSTKIVLAQKKIKNFPQLLELWKIKEAYVHLLIQTHLIPKNYVSKHPLKPFRINKFLNEVPNFSKDKRGYNIAILIVHVLFLISNKKHDAVLKRMDVLKQYSFRYLKAGKTFRSNCFIKMILKIPKANYHPIAVKRHTQKIYNRFKISSYQYTENPEDFEVIPYEHLWEIVFEILNKNLKKRTF